MPKLVKDGAAIDDHWAMIRKDDPLPQQRIDADELLILPLALWLAHCGELAGKDNIAVWLDSDEPPAMLCEAKEGAVDCTSLPLIAINFPVFSDGRGYSYARQLREHYGFNGELRAVGDILRDQLYFYKRCGFNSFAMRDDCDAEAALESLQDFSQNYQAANDDAVPVFRRR